MLEVVLFEADPNNWPGAGKRQEDMTAQDRGDRYWCKKNANQAITTAVKIETLIALYQRKDRDSGVTGIKVIESTESQVVAFEKEAQKRISALTHV